jgi:tetratricopeptide (TPR) repeat protein
MGLVGWVAAGCSSAPPPAPVGPSVDAEDRRFLLPPADGFPAAADPAVLQRLQTAFEGRLLRGDAAGALRVADEALASDPELGPALVLRGQAQLVARDLAAARESLAPVVARHPTYTAAGLAAARVAELLGEISEAYAILRSLAPASPLALERAAELHDRVVEVVAGRVEDSLRRGRVDDARGHLAQLREWAAGERITLDSTVAVARATNDQRTELLAVRELLALPGADPALVERRGELELAVGDPAVAIEIFGDLVERHPAEVRYTESLDLAKFRWRANNLPEEVRRLLDKPELLRGDYAVLLYWLVPGVRAGVASAPRIATDILEHPQRQEIMRVVNLQLMDVDETLRRFEPAHRVRRVHAIRALLRVLQRAPAPPSCVAPLEGNSTPSREAVCRTAAACGFVPEPADCLPEAGVSGSEASVWIRRTQVLLGS